MKHLTLFDLEICCSVPVLDRVGLIIEIFAQRARTREARLQVNLLCFTLRSCLQELPVAVDHIQSPNPARYQEESPCEDFSVYRWSWQR